MDFIDLLPGWTWRLWFATKHSAPVEVRHVERCSAESAFTYDLFFLHNH